jgi:hypothetical protein
MVAFLSQKPRSGKRIDIPTRLDWERGIEERQEQREAFKQAEADRVVTEEVYGETLAEHVSKLG